MDEEPVAPRKRTPAVPVDLETVILKCLEKDPARRYLTAKALAEGEAALAEGEAALVAGRADAAEKHASDMEALGRRTKEVLEKEGVQAEREARLVAERAAVSTVEAEIVRFRKRLDEAIGEFRIGTDNPSKPKET